MTEGSQDQKTRRPGDQGILPSTSVTNEDAFMGLYPMEWEGMERDGMGWEPFTSLFLTFPLLPTNKHNLRITFIILKYYDGL